jgi:Uma2 family endonuclease
VLQEFLHRLVPSGFLIRTEQPITCADSEPEPDLAVVRGQASDFRETHPPTAELVIEVCVTSTDYDRSKLRAYASAGVTECWLVLAGQKQIEVHTEPQPNQFTSRVLYGPNGQCVSSTIPQVVVDLPSFFGN